jgi:flagellar protein FlbD
MILVTRLNGDQIYVNPDLIERLEATPDTVLTFVDDKKVVVTESPELVIERIVAFRARILAKAETIYRSGDGDAAAPPLRLVLRDVEGE